MAVNLLCMASSTFIAVVLMFIIICFLSGIIIAKLSYMLLSLIPNIDTFISSINDYYLLIAASIAIFLLLFFFIKKFHRIKYSIISLFEMPEKEKAQRRERRVECYESSIIVKFKCEYVEDFKDGEEILYYPTGEVNRIRHWKSGKLHGKVIVYYKNGAKYITGQYCYGKPVGNFCVFKSDGQKLKTIRYYG